MALAQRIESLEHEHQALKDAVHTAELHPYEDMVALKAMKLKKLHMKEELERLRTKY